MSRLATITQAINPCKVDHFGSPCAKKADHEGPHRVVWIDAKGNRRNGLIWED